MLLHTINRSLKLLEQEPWDELKKGHVTKAHGTLFEDLCRSDFLVPESVDEAKVLKNWRNSQYYSNKELAVKAKITEDCNLACDFCIQEGMKRPVGMSREIAEQCVTFIKERIVKEKPEVVRVVLTGGEPLMNPTAIRSFGTLYQFCNGMGIPCDLSLTTNGTLLTRKMVRDLQWLGVRTIRVSIFGTQETHDQRRTFKNGSGSYKLIEQNLLDAAAFVRFRILIQYDEQNEDYLKYPELFQRLRELGLDEAVEDVELGPLLPREYDFGEMGSSLCAKVTKPEIYAYLEDEARKNGLKPPVELPSSGCMANYRSCLVIDVDGNLVGCPTISHSQHPDLTYGNVCRGIDFVKESQIIARPLPDSCFECNVAGLCDGGCRQQSLVKNGDFDGLHCTREYLETLVRKYMEDKVNGHLSSLRGAETGRKAKAA